MKNVILFITAFCIFGISAGHADAATVTLDSVTNTAATVTLNSPSTTDFYVFGDNTRKSGGPSAFSDVSTDKEVGHKTDSPIGIAWTGGDPVASSSGSPNFDYGQFGSDFAADRITYAQFTLTMPSSTSTTLDFWLRPNGNGNSITYDVTVGNVTNSYNDTSGNDDLQRFTYSISGATINEVITVRIDNVAGSNGWHNVGFMAAQVPSSSTDSYGNLTSAAGVTEPVALPSIADTAGEAVNIFDFTLTDGGSADGLTLDVSEIVLHTSGTGDFSKVTWRLNGPDASDVTGAYSSGGNTVTFSGLTVSVADGASEVYTINAYYSDNTGLTDGQTYVLSTDGDTDLTVDAAKTQMTTTTEVNNSTGTAVDIAGTLLAFGTQPADTPAGSNISAFTVEVRDAFGNADTDSTASVTLSLSSNPGTSVLTGTNPVSAVSGVATFSDISPDKIGTGYTFDAASGGLTTGTCDTFSITTAAPALDSSGSPALTGITEDIADGSDTGTLVSAVIASLGGTGITDSDPGQAEGIAVTAVDDTGGNWQFDPAGGTSWTNFSAVLPSDTSATLLAPAANIRFVPVSDYNGAPEITFRAWDQTLGTNGDTGVDVSGNGGATPYSSAAETASVTVTAVNDAPAITGQTALTTPEETELTLTLSHLTVTDPDSIWPGDFTLTAQDGTNYTRTGNAVTPDAYFNGTLTVPVTVSDGTDPSDVFSLEVTVTPVNDVPVITGQTSLVTPEDTELTVTPDHLTVTDPDNTYPDDFTLTLQDGTDYTRSGNAITPDADFDGTLTVPLTVSDGTDTSDVFSLEVTVMPVNDVPVITGQTSVITPEETELTLTLSHLTVNDPDNTWPDDFTLTAQDGTNYTRSGNAITPDTDFNGTLTVPVTVSDGTDESDVFNLEVTVIAVSDVPVIISQTPLTTPAETALEITLDDLTVTDADSTFPDDFTLAVQDGSSYSRTGNTVTPANGFSGTLTVPVTVNDGTDESDVFSLGVTVTANEEPEITGQSALTTPERTPLAVSLSNLTVTDTDDTWPDDFTLTVQDGANYTRSGSTVTPVTGFIGELTVPVTVNDGISDSNLFQLKITVTKGPNSAPVITGQVQELSVPEGSALLITLGDLSVTDSDNTYPDDFTLAVSDGSNYTHSGNSVIPSSDFTGDLSVPVTVNDGTDDSDPYNLSITVTEKIAIAPEITEQKNLLSALQETDLLITLSDLDVTPNSDKAWPADFILRVLDGKNYTHSGNTITPTAGFAGDLTVSVNVSDGVNESNVFSLMVTVTARSDSKQITGTVTYNGSGMSDVTVTAVSLDIGDASESDTTDAGGKFDMAVSGGKWQVTVTQEDDADWVSPEPAAVSFANDNSSETENLSLTLQTRIARMTGKVLPPTGDTGLGEGITMNVFNSDTQFSRDFYPDADGSFSFPVPAGTYTLSVRPDLLKYPGYAGVQVPLTRISEDTALSDIRLLARNVLLSGTVRDDKEKGVPGISVDAWQPGGELFSVNTDAGGGYEFSLTPGTYTVKPSPAQGSDFRFAGSPAEAVLTGGDSETADFSLDAASHIIVGKVRDTAGKLLRNVDAWAYARFEDSPQPITRARVAKGEFTLSVPEGTLYVGLDLAPGSVYSFAQETRTSVARSAPSPLPPHLSPARAAIAEMSVYEQVVQADGRGRDSKDITVTLEPDDAFIKGAVLDENGSTAADMQGQVIATPAGNRTSVQTAEIRNGRFEIPAAGGLWSLTCQLRTDRYGQADPVQVSVEGGKVATGNILLIPLGSMVSGQVTDDEGKPVSDILVWVRVPRGEGDSGGIFEAQVLTDSDGEFEVFVPGGGTGKRGWGSQASVGTAVQRCNAEEDEYEPPFELTDESFDEMRNADVPVPEDVISTLQAAMTNQFYLTEYAFTSELRAILNSYFTYHNYKPQILEHAATGRTEGMVASCLRESAAQTTLPSSRPGWGRDAREEGVTLELRKADTFLAGTVLDTDGNPVAGVSVSAYSADGQKADGRTDGSGDYRLYIARADETDENSSNNWTVVAVSESGDGKYYRGRIQCDAFGTDETVVVEGISLSSEEEFPLTQTGEFRAEDGWSHTLSDGTRIQIPGGAVPTGEEFVKAIVEPRAEEVPESSGNHIISHGYSVSLFEKESGREILGKLNRDILMTFRYRGADLLDQGIRTQNIRPAYFSEASDSWQRAESFTPETGANKITFQTGHLSVWSLVATQIGDETEPGDMNSDGAVDLADMIAVLQVCVQFSSSVSEKADVSGDGRIGLAEAIYILRQIAGM